MSALIEFVLTMTLGLFAVGVIFTALYVLIGLSFDMVGSIWANHTHDDKRSKR